MLFTSELENLSGLLLAISVFYSKFPYSRVWSVQACCKFCPPEDSSILGWSLWHTLFWREWIPRSYCVCFLHPAVWTFNLLLPDLTSHSCTHLELFVSSSTTLNFVRNWVLPQLQHLLLARHLQEKEAICLVGRINQHFNYADIWALYRFSAGTYDPLLLFSFSDTGLY